jgi:hypothetical protein
MLLLKRLRAKIAAGSDFLGAALSKPIERDYRMVVVVAIAIYFFILYLSSFFGDYHIFWQKWFQVKALLPSFLDLRVLTSGFECHRQGYDVTLQNPCDPLGRPAPYPRIWWSLAIFGLDQSHTNLLGIAMAIILYGLVYLFIGKINLAQSILYSLFLCSPTAMLLVERGNNDMIIFYLFIFSLWLLQSNTLAIRGLSYALIYLSMALKLFPVFGFVTICKERPKWFWRLFGMVIGGIFIYILLFQQEIQTIMNAERMAEQSSEFTYGPKTLLFQLSTPSELKREALSMGAFILFAPSLYQIIHRFRQSLRTHLPKLDLIASTKAGSMSTLKTDAFRLGAAIYIATALVSVSWDYRLFFLLLTFPKLLELLSLNISAYLPLTALIATLATLYLSSFSLLDECANLVLLVVHSYLFWEMRPIWLKNATFKHLNQSV